MFIISCFAIYLNIYCAEKNDVRFILRIAEISHVSNEYIDKENSGIFGLNYLVLIRI